MGELPRSDWSHGEYIDEDDINYEQFHRSVGDLSYKALRSLSVDLESLTADKHGWTAADIDAIAYLYEIDWLGSLMVPPAATPLDNRTRANDLFRSLRNALPFTDAERWWLLTEALGEAQQSGVNKYDEGYLDIVRDRETTIVTNGIRRAASGGELLHRFWLWRRQAGEYSTGEGLGQARESLAGLVDLLTPDIGLRGEPAV